MKCVNFIFVTLTIYLFIFNFPRNSFSKTSSTYTEYENQSEEVIAEDIHKKLLLGEFELVEGYVDYLLKTKRKILNHNLLYLIYSFIAEKTDITDSMLSKWIENSSHYSPLVFRAYLYANEGWKIRGSGYAYTVSQEKFAEFRKKLELAKHDLENAYKLQPGDPNISAEMISVSRGLGLSRDIMEMWFERGVSADPLSYELYNFKLQFISPKWGGNDTEYYNYAKLLYDSPPEGSYADTLIFDSLFWLFYNPKTRKIYEEKLTITNINNIFDTCLKRYPDSKVLRIKSNKLLGSIYFNQNDNLKAENHFVELTELDPKNHWAWFMLGQMYYKSYNKYQESMIFFNKAIEIKKDEAWYYRERGWASMYAGLYTQCIEDLSTAIAGGYKSEDVYKVLEICKVKLDQKKE
jgi:tetratricopeptide (TPR) repeat protein